MKKRKKSTMSSVFLGLFIVLSLMVTPLMANENLEAVKTAAQQGMKSFLGSLSSLPVDEIRNYNFDSKQEVDRAKAGEPFKIYTITPDSVFSYQEGTMIADLISPTTFWCIPITVDGDIRTLLDIDKVDGNYKAISLGSAGTAVRWGEILESLNPAQKKQAVFVKVYQAGADLVLINDDKGILIPIDSAFVGLGSNNNLMIELKQIVKENLKQF
jgi:hypothetical protein